MGAAIVATAVVLVAWGTRAAHGPVHPDPALHFWLVSGAAASCLVAALWLLRAGLRVGGAEVTLIGLGASTLSTLALVHGLTAPGFLYGPNPASATAAALALPAGLGAGLPLVAISNASGRVPLVRWRTWPGIVGAATAVVAAGLLASPGSVPEALTDERVRGVLTAASFTAVILVVRRHVRIFAIGRRVASLVAALAALVIGIASVTGTASPTASVVWWAAQALDALAVLALVVGVAVAYRPRRAIVEVLAPVTARDPLVALELGVSPEVHAFVAALERKDAQTRDHVVRVAELAMRVAERAGLNGVRLRAVGLGGLLHDVGKLVVPSDVLTKPGRLTDEEYRVITSHAERGARLIEASAPLRVASHIVRWHHERHDGTGYPDGLAGDEIPIEVAIVSAADAWDAMVSDRHYRPGMGPERARRIMEEQADRQWRRSVVDLVLVEVRESASPPGDRPVLDRVGRDMAPRRVAELVGW